MPAWGKMLKPEQVDAVVAYVLSLRGTNPANAKAPEGTVMAPPGTGGSASSGPAPAGGTSAGSSSGSSTSGAASSSSSSSLR
jgi:cytochrome c oxidase cbb3-type subunit 3